MTAPLAAPDWLEVHEVNALVGSAASVLTIDEVRRLREWCGRDAELRATIEVTRRLLLDGPVRELDATAAWSVRGELDTAWLEALRDLCWIYRHRGEVAMFRREPRAPFTSTRNDGWRW